MCFGMTLELHPATDRWRRGDRFGVVITLLPKQEAVVLKMCVSRRRVTVPLDKLVSYAAVDRLRENFAARMAE